MNYFDKTFVTFTFAMNKCTYIAGGRRFARKSVILVGMHMPFVFNVGDATHL